jgi:peptide-methionine (R)-S-oxide reductase
MDDAQKDELIKKLTPEEFQITQESGTEAPFSGEYYNHHENGMYSCKVCENELFASGTKFDSGSGWPSFTEPANRENVELIPDDSSEMHRIEVRCKHCGAHLGHVFGDGPVDKGGKRFCINSASLNFKKTN